MLNSRWREDEQTETESINDVCGSAMCAQHIQQREQVSRSFKIVYPILQRVKQSTYLFNATVEKSKNNSNKTFYTCNTVYYYRTVELKCPDESWFDFTWNGECLICGIYDLFDETLAR